MAEKSCYLRDTLVFLGVDITNSRIQILHNTYLLRMARLFIDDNRYENIYLTVMADWHDAIRNATANDNTTELQYARIRAKYTFEFFRAVLQDRTYNPVKLLWKLISG